jgi:hypothetical protein
MKVRIVSRADIDGWILGKFARKLQSELTAIGVEADIAGVPDNEADINHYMIYYAYDTANKRPMDSIMITHIDKVEKLDEIKIKMQSAGLGICMSAETMKLLVDSGIEHSRLAYVNPAHDSVISRKKVYIGLASTVYADGRKREQFLVQLAKFIDPSAFAFRIVGEGWQPIVDVLRSKGIEVEYHSTFVYDTYINLIPTLDYYLYMGQDEGSMGFVDALSAGVKTIVTPQGYHLDARNGITHSFETLNELKAIFDLIAQEKTALIQSVDQWTWRHYAIKHHQLWHYLLTGEAMNNNYPDGLNSLLGVQGKMPSKLKQSMVKMRILRLTFSRFVHSTDKLGKVRRKLKL